MTASTAEPPPATRSGSYRGRVITIPQADYCYGVGDLKIQVLAVAEEFRHRGIEWVYVAGIPIRWDGHRGERREVLVRASTLRALLQQRGS